LEKFVADLLSVLEQYKICTLEKDGPILSALSDFWHRIIKRSTAAWQQKFIRGMKQTFEDGGMWAFDCISSKRRPELDEYIRLRQYLGAANLATDSLEITAKIDLSEGVYTHPIVEKLTEAARNAICFSNDLFSLGKEEEHNAEFNIVTILQHKHSLTIEEAIRQAAVIHNKTVRDFIKLSKEALIFDRETNVKLHNYIRALCCLMKGNIEWSTQNTTRYPHIYGYKKKRIEN
jgi:hypothetical protein